MSKYFIRKVVCESYEDNYYNGYLRTDSDSYWSLDESDFKMDFDTIEEALHAVLKKLCFDYDGETGHFDCDTCLDEPGRFDGGVMVNEDNIYATSNQIEDWKQGKTRLWDCNITVYLAKRVIEELTIEDVENFHDKSVNQQ